VATVALGHNRGQVSYTGVPVLPEPCRPLYSLFRPADERKDSELSMLGSCACDSKQCRAVAQAGGRLLLWFKSGNPWQLNAKGLERQHDMLAACSIGPCGSPSADKDDSSNLLGRAAAPTAASSGGSSRDSSISPCRGAAAGAGAEEAGEEAQPVPPPALQELAEAPGATATTSGSTSSAEASAGAGASEQPEHSAMHATGLLVRASSTTPVQQPRQRRPRQLLDLLLGPGGPDDPQQLSLRSVLLLRPSSTFLGNMPRAKKPGTSASSARSLPAAIRGQVSCDAG
jgi:hypothetical protein